MPTILLMVVMCLVGGVACPLWNRAHSSHWYLGIGDSALLPGGDPTATSNQSIVINVFYYVNLLSGFLPVALYVSISVVKKSQAWLMEQDLRLYDPGTDTRMQVGARRHYERSAEHGSTCSVCMRAYVVWLSGLSRCGTCC
jgi:hypothetical protein